MKKTVFISSTYTDLIEIRREVKDLLKKYNVNIKGMEEFGARTETPLDTCLNEVSQSDIYIGIIAHRLGSIEKNTGKSFTQLEYELAVKEEKVILIYIVDDDEYQVPKKYIDTGKDYEILNNFKSRLKSNHTIDTFKGSEELSEKLKIWFDKQIQNNEIKKSSSNDSTEIQDDFKKSENIIRRFHLFPVKYSDIDLRIVFSFNGNAYPASEEFCEQFGYFYGKTIIVPIKIKTPGIENNELSEILLEEELAEIYFDNKNDYEHDCIARLRFSTDNISSSKANFFDEVYYTEKPNPNYDPSRPENSLTAGSALAALHPFFNNPKHLSEKHIQKGEGKAILVLRELLKKSP